MDDSPIQSALCAIGHPIAGNPTQFVTQRALAALGLDWQFISFDVQPEMLQRAIAGIDSLGFCGAIIAPPYQTEVYRILQSLAAGTNVTPVDAAPDDSWHDCLIRDENHQLLAVNLLAPAATKLLAAHGQVIGHPLDRCLLVGDSAVLPKRVLPLSQLLPPQVDAVVGAALVPWAVTAAAESEVVGQQDEDESVTEFEAPVAQACLVPQPRWIIWTLDSKPSKKHRGKAASTIPPTEFLLDLLPQLHGESLVFDLSGTYPAWAAAAATDGTPRRVITSVDLDVERLVLAIERWTGTGPDIETIREAIEEYLEI